MEESKDLKTGQTTQYQIEGKTVVMKPLTLGKMKKAMAAFQKKDVDTFEMMAGALTEILNNGENKFATRDWINDNVTMPLATRMIADMRIINGLEGFFPQGAAPKTPAPLETRELSETTPTPSV